MIEQWKENVNNGGEFDALMTNLSIAFDCSHYELWMAKLDVFSFDVKSVKFMKKKIKD